MGCVGSTSRSQRQQQEAGRSPHVPGKEASCFSQNGNSSSPASGCGGGGRNLGDQTPRGAPPSTPSNALVSRARSLAGRGLTAAFSLLPVVIATRECGCEGSELPPSGGETPGRRKSPSRSCEKKAGEGGKSILQFVCLVGKNFFLNRYLKKTTTNISVLLSVIISGEISQNHQNVTETRRERQEPRQYLQRPGTRATLERERVSGGRWAAAPPNFGAGGAGWGSEGAL